MTPLDNEPTSLYRFYDKNERLLYVGITARGRGRWHNHAKDKPWWGDVCNATVEHHPDRLTALDAEKHAIVTEKPVHNVVHNTKSPNTRRQHTTSALRENSPPTEAQWWNFSLRQRSDGQTRREQLWLYPEPDMSSCVDDVWDMDGQDQVHYWIDQLKGHHPLTAVPIYWSVAPIGETAPFQTYTVGDEDFLSYFTWPTDDEGYPLDWFTLPVLPDRFPELWEAIGWKPSPLQPTMPLADIINSKRAVYPHTRRPRSNA